MGIGGGILKGNISFNYIYFLCCAIASISSSFTFGQDSLNFPPPAKPDVIQAIRTNEKINLDGKLDESIWREAPPITNFYRMEPRQGGEYLFKTEVRVVYDNKYIYFGVFCKDPMGRKGIRVQDFRRDFIGGENDAFFVQLDPQNLKRFCVSFQVTPLGTQRDLQVFDDQFTDSDWDALWKVKTTITNEGYFAEYAIPFKSLRYSTDNKDSVSWNLTYGRIARRDYEQTVFPKIPQAFSPYRMAYGAKLKGLQVPKPSINLRIQPYGLFQHSEKTMSDGSELKENNWKAGGEIKWAVRPRAVVDLTFNTDFAQADVDRAVNDLTRFNVFFPERRQFFLENQGVFAGANVSGVKPFFSRSIGLGNTRFNASPVPIDFGVRYTDRNQKRTLAGIGVRQRKTDFQGPVNFGVLRWLQNYGDQNNVGIMFTHRLDQPVESLGLKERNNTTLTVDGLIRPNNKLSFQYLASFSRENSFDNSGNAGSAKIQYNSNKFFFYYRNRWVSRKYIPGMGFIFQSNVIHHQTVQFLPLRPKGKHWSWVREWEVGFDVNYYQNASDLGFQQADLYIYPVYIILKNGGLIQYAIFPTWQNIDFDFSILGIPINKERYYYLIHQFDLNSNQSRKVSFKSDFTVGNYYNGKIKTASFSLRFAPIPNIALVGYYSYNQFKRLGINIENKETHLYIGEARLAVNRDIQASLFYQFNSFDKQGRWNIRGSWQFAPLSYLYIVFNETSFSNSIVEDKAIINKITYVRQF